MCDNENYSKLSRRKALALLGLGTIAIQFPIGCTERRSSEKVLESDLLHYKTISEISKMIKSREISSTELT